ncbi:hypothetical protein, partial [Ligilactobacillus ruminis]|uniref:hypothetical protein n=1 Tax=Ligilactobacillus ruminis TaxID=1623 RepID=UPI001CDD25FB
VHLAFFIHQLYHIDMGKVGKGKRQKKKRLRCLSEGFPPITKVTVFQPIYLSMKRTSYGYFAIFFTACFKIKHTLAIIDNVEI